MEKITNLLIECFSIFSNFDLGIAFLILESVKNLQVKFKEYNNLNYMDKYKYSKLLYYFFRKIGSNTKFYNLSMEEKSLKMTWNGKYENTNYNESDLGEINYEIKYASLVNDTLYKTDSYDTGEEKQTKDNEDEEFFG